MYNKNSSPDSCSNSLSLLCYSARGEKQQHTFSWRCSRLPQAKSAKHTLPASCMRARRENVRIQTWDFSVLKGSAEVRDGQKFIFTFSLHLHTSKIIHGLVGFAKYESFNQSNCLDVEIQIIFLSNLSFDEWWRLEKAYFDLMYLWLSQRRIDI